MPDFGRWTPNGGDPSLNEINRTDRFLDALGTEQPVYATDPGEAELINLLSGWRDEIRQTPLTVPVTPRDAVIALDSAQRTRQRSRRTLAIVGSAAAAVLCLGGFVSVVAGAGPGDSLYGLRTMIFGEQQATRDDAVMLASQQLAEVQQLVDEGQWDAAQQKLQTLTTTVATVNDDVQKQELVSQWQELTVKVEAKDAAATLPPDVPPPTFPQVVVLDTPTSSDTSSSETTTTSGETSSSSETSPTSPTSSTSSTSSETTSPTTSTSSETTTSTSPTSPPPETTASTPPSTSPPVQAPPPTSVPATTPSPVATQAEETSAPPVTTQVEETAPSQVTQSVVTTPKTTVAVTTTKPLPATSETVPEAAQEEPTTAEAPPVQREAPKSAVTTIIEAPAPEAGADGS